MQADLFSDGGFSALLIANSLQSGFQGNSYYGLTATVRVYRALLHVASHDSNRPSETNMLMLL